MEREAAVLFVDLAGFTALTEAHGDLDAADVADRLSALARASLQEGRIVKTMGDGVMIVCRTIEAAVVTAFRIAEAVEAQPSFPMARMGIHSGPVVEREGDFFGGTVNIAARVGAHARAGQILATEVVATTACGAGLATCAALGPIQLKNLVQPYSLFALSPPAARRTDAAVDPVCRMMVTTASAAACVSFGGREYHFCSPGCAAKFCADPSAYTRQDG